MPFNIRADWPALLRAVSPSDITPVMFGGEGAKNAPLATLPQAKAMAAVGATPEDIYARTTPTGSPGGQPILEMFGAPTGYVTPAIPPQETTGWFQSPDDRWRFEFSDAVARLDPRKLQALFEQNPQDRAGTQDIPYGNFTLKDILLHPELFKQYPSLENVKVEPVPPERQARGVLGGYNKETDTLKLANIPAEALATILHETQHAIQSREGFAEGGDRQTRNDILRDLRKVLDNAKALTPEWIRAKNRYFDYKKSMQEETPHQSYKKLAGEVEARNVEGRRGMDLEERRATPGFRTQDFPSTEQYVYTPGKQ